MHLAGSRPTQITTALKSFHIDVVLTVRLLVISLLGLAAATAGLLALATGLLLAATAGLATAATLLTALLGALAARCATTLRCHGDQSGGFKEMKTRSPFLRSIVHTTQTHAPFGINPSSYQTWQIIA